MEHTRPEIHRWPSDSFNTANRPSDKFYSDPCGPSIQQNWGELPASQYLHVTMDRQLGGFQIDCASEAEAQRLAKDLNVLFAWSDTQQPEAQGRTVIYRGSVRLLARFLSSRKWKLTMDSTTSLVFERPDQ